MIATNHLNYGIKGLPFLRRRNQFKLVVQVKARTQANSWTTVSMSERLDFEFYESSKIDMTTTQSKLE